MSAITIAFKHPLIAFQGVREFRCGVGMTWGDMRDDAYDFGRDLAHRLTQRRWDEAARDYCYSPKCERVTVWNGEFCSRCGREWGYEL